MSAGFPWLPIGHALPDGTDIGRLISEGPGYQIACSRMGGRTVLLLEEDTEAARRLAAEAGEAVMRAAFLGRRLLALAASADAAPVRVTDMPARPGSLTVPEAASLSEGLAEMAQNHPRALWAEAIFLPDLDLCLPIEDGDDEDRRSLGMRLLTGGVEDATLSPKQAMRFNPWFTEAEIADFLQGFGVEAPRAPKLPDTPFRLPGRPELEAFFRDYVIDHHRQRERYAAMGVAPPNGILLYGPPGSGKTFAVRALATYLGWPVFELGLGNVGSPYIHQTSRQLHALFEAAGGAAPSIVVVDEVDALAATRAAGTQSHKIEEISELLKLVEGAAANGITVVATTNRREAIDPAFLRKGRFDHVFEVGYPGEAEVLAALEALIAERPHVPGLGLAAAAGRLAGRPMSDAAWAVNEAARLAVKSGKDAIDDICLFGAVAKLK